ncbi:MAG: hypothetical protein RIC55_13530 [Pirellulaceae bacterium]
MKRCLIALAVAAVLGSTAQAQQPETPNKAGDVGDQQLSLTPEMLMYLQAMRRYDDPKQAVRRNAEMKAAQRRQRLASMEWFGYSNQRPQASVTPFMGTYSPVWTGNSWDPYRWVGVGYPHFTIRLDSVRQLR